MIFDVFLFNMRLVIQHSDVFDIYFFDTTLLASQLLTCASVTNVYMLILGTLICISA